MDELQNLLKNSDISQNKRIIFARDFNIFFNSKVEAKSDIPLLKKIHCKICWNKRSLDICDIWGIRNPNTRNFTFRQSHSTGSIERRLDYIFISISNCLQNLLIMKILQNLLITCSINWSFSLLISLLSHKSHKSDNSLVYDEVYAEKMKKNITEINNANKFTENAKTKWEFLKYEIRKFTIDYSKVIAIKKKKQKISLDLKLKNFREQLKLWIK